MTKVVDFEVEEDGIVGIEGGFLAEIRRGPREGWRPGASGPYYVVEAASPEAAVRAARAFVNRQE